MKNEFKPCNFMCSAVSDASYDITKLNLKNLLHKTVPFFENHPALYSRAKSTYATVFLRGKRAYPEVQMNGETREPLNLQPGELVEVRSKEEIFSTLNERGRNKGLYFMPEMIKFCGKRYKVFKRVSKIRLESNGELRKLKTPSIFLRDVLCDGEFNYGCERACFLYWREEWLKRVNE
ncbi:MAG: hypothetical protein HPY61_14875 [Methanotrichaceae archaeon]|nr:hypothetical protein [Methanotrichaceae archaeon]